jgi:Flp pilus assembly protein TadG
MTAFGRSERAQSLIEFALTLPILLLIVTGLLDVARAVWQENTLAYAAREGTRYAIVHGSASTPVTGPGNAQPVVDAVLNAAVGVANVTVVAMWPDASCNQRGCRVQVDATAPFVPLPSQYLLNGAFQITLRGGSSLVIQK